MNNYIADITEKCSDEILFKGSHDVDKLLNLLIAILESLNVFVEDVNYDGIGLYLDAEKDMAVDTLLEILDTVEGF